MRRRILQSMIAMVLGVALLLGLPLMFTAWWWVDDAARADLKNRLSRISVELSREHDSGKHSNTPGGYDQESLRLLIPEGGQLRIYLRQSVATSAPSVIGDKPVGPTLEESLSLGEQGSLQLVVSHQEIRDRQWAAVGVVSLVVTASIALGMAVAAVTAKRLADPLEALGDQAARMARGDFAIVTSERGIDEVDRVSDALNAAMLEIAMRLEREGQIVGEVSHQLRSRLTAIRLRLDELSLHRDPDVVTEADAALGQVDRLSRELDELIAASRRSELAARVRVDVVDEVSGVVDAFSPAFAGAGRHVVLDRPDRVLVARVTVARLREAVSVLLDNSLRHGGGTCEVRCSDLDGPDMIRVSVSDGGPGIDDASAQHIFRRGYSEGGSSGMGLALARALVEADGGRLDLTARRPATFAITVPADGGSVGTIDDQRPSTPDEPR